MHVVKVLGLYPKAFGKPFNILSKGNYSEFPISIELLLAISGTGNLVTLPPPNLLVCCTLINIFLGVHPLRHRQ